MGTSAPENRIYGISGLWDLGIMGFVICGILVLWEKEGEEGRNRERRVGQEPWSISPFQVRACENRRSGPFSGRDNCRERDREGERGFSNHSFPLGLPICCDDILAVEVSLVDPEGVVIASKKGVVLN